METLDTTSQVDNEGRMTFWTTELPEIIQHEFSHDLNFTIGLQKQYNKTQYQKYECIYLGTFMTSTAFILSTILFFNYRRNLIGET